MTRPVLGQAAGKALAIDLTRLLETRALITASSGWGKGWALRRLVRLQSRAPAQDQALTRVDAAGPEARRAGLCASGVPTARATGNSGAVTVH